MCLPSGHTYTPHPTPEAHTFHTYSEVLPSFLRLWHVAWVLVLHPSFASFPPKFQDLCQLPGTPFLGIPVDNCADHPDVFITITYSWKLAPGAVLTPRAVLPVLLASCEDECSLQRLVCGIQSGSNGANHWFISCFPEPSNTPNYVKSHVLFPRK